MGKLFSISNKTQIHCVGWCVKEFPEMKEYYEKYKSQVEFIGIACDDKKTEWREIVKKFQLDWTQLLNSAKNDVLSNTV